MRETGKYMEQIGKIYGTSMEHGGNNSETYGTAKCDFEKIRIVL